MPIMSNNPVPVGSTQELLAKAAMDAPPATSFVNIAFLLYWKHHKIEEPVKYFSIREAFHLLREATGMDQVELAACLWMTTNKLNGVEIRGTYLTPKQYETLLYITRSYSLPVLADYFESQRDYALSKVPAKRGRAGKSGLGEDEPEWVKVMGDGA
jgi:hypothetical protein